MFQDKLTKEIAAAAAQIKTEPPKNEVNTKSVEGAVVSIMANEELKGNQHKIDANKNGKIDAHDFKLLRAKKDMKKEEIELDEAKTQSKDEKNKVVGAVQAAMLKSRGNVIAGQAQRAAARLAAKVKSGMKKEEIEQLDEVGDTPAGRKALHKYVDKAISTAMYKPNEIEKRKKGLRKATSRLYKDNFYGKKNEEVEMNEEDAYNKDRYAVKNGKATKDNPTHMGSPNYKDQPHHVWATSAEHAVKKSMKKEEVEELDELSKGTLGSYTKKAVADYGETSGKEGSTGSTRYGSERLDKREKGIDRAVDRLSGTKKSYKMKEEVEELDEGFPTVADAKKRMAAKESPFEKKKISTGTVYSRKYKSEPDDADDMPKKKAKTMKEMLNIYKNHGAESLIENLMIEEPSQDEYKKEVEVAQAKSEGKIRNDKQIAKAATQSVKMEEVEIEVLDADEINGVQIDNIDERSLTEPEMKKREEIVKSMKKGIQGFKDRYGERAKSVMYATAAKIAKEKA